MHILDINFKHNNLQACLLKKNVQENQIQREFHPYLGDTVWCDYR